MALAALVLAGLAIGQMAIVTVVMTIALTR